ncbi:putative ribonuclease H-like domain-containing protein [Tanacetum coccineum]
MNAVPPPITGKFMPTSIHSDFDESQMTYGKKSNDLPETDSNNFVSCASSDKPSDPKTNDFASCDSSDKSSPKSGDSSVFSDSAAESESTSKTAVQEDISFNNTPTNRMGVYSGHRESRPMWKNVDNIPPFVPQAAHGRSSKVTIPAGRVTVPAPIPTGRRTGPAPVYAGTPVPADGQNRPTPVHAGRPFPAGRRNSVSVVLGKIEDQICNGDPRTMVVSSLNENPLKNKDLGIVDSGGLRSMSGNKERLDDFVLIKGGTMTFGGGLSVDYLERHIQNSRLDFENVYYVKELQNFNLFSVSQICDKKNNVLFTETECLVLSTDFKLPDDSQVVLRVPRRHNLYSFNLNELQPKGNLACLVAKVSLDESTKWHRRMAYVNFKNINKLAKNGLVKGLPSKIFTNEHNCVACNKGKQHKATYKAITSIHDSDFAGANNDRKSITDGCQFLERRLISWQCKKQTIVATSSTKAEYVAATNCCGQLKEEFKKIQKALEHAKILDFKRTLPWSKHALEEPSSKKLKPNDDDIVADSATSQTSKVATQDPDDLAAGQATQDASLHVSAAETVSAGIASTTGVAFIPADTTTTTHPAVTTDSTTTTIPTDPNPTNPTGATTHDADADPTDETQNASTPVDLTISSLSSTGTPKRRKRTARKRAPKPFLDMDDQSLIKFDSVLSTPLGEINALYRIDGVTKHFTTLREILHMVDRQDLMKLYGIVDKFYQTTVATGVGLILWGDLKVLLDSMEGGAGYSIWGSQQNWQVRSWRLYTFSNVHVLETMAGIVLYMFVDVPYPLSVKLMERMLKHKLELARDVVGNDLTTAEQLIGFIKNQLAAAQECGASESAGVYVSSLHSQHICSYAHMLVKCFAAVPSQVSILKAKIYLET